MRMKTYQAETVEAAFAAIKAEMGAEAIILDTTHARTGRTLMHPFGRTIVSVQAAVDYPTRQEKPLAHVAQPMPAPSAETRPATLTAGTRSASSKPSGVSVGTAARVENLFERLLADSVKSAWPGDEGGESDEVAPRAESATEAAAASSSLAAASSSLCAELQARGCESETAQHCVAEALKMLSGQHDMSMALLRDSLRAAVTKHLRLRTQRVTRRGQPRCLAVVGPTGSGKTLALSKLAAQSIQHGYPTTVVKIEPKPSATVDPLQVTTVELGARLDIVRSGRELGGILSRHQEDAVVLVDVPGRCLRDSGEVAQWRSWLSVTQPIEVHLVVPAQMLRQDFDDLLGALADVPLHRLLFTKLDETDRYGRMVEMILHSPVAPSYLSIGQDPQGVIEVATPDRLAGLVCGEALEEALGGRESADAVQGHTLETSTVGTQSAGYRL